MSQLTVVPHGDAVAVVIPVTILESIGVGVGDALEVILGDQRLTLRPFEGAARQVMMPTPVPSSTGP